MVTAFPLGSTTDFCSQSLNFEAIAAKKTVQQNLELVQAEVETWDTYRRTLRRATAEALVARRIAQRDYKKVQAEADRWERRLQIALKDDREDLVGEALQYRNACRDRAHQLKVLIEHHSIQVSSLKSEIAYWAKV